MKKKIFLGIAGVVAAAVFCVTMSINDPGSNYSDLMAQNIEALADNEAVDAECYTKAGETCTVNIYVEEGPDGGGILTVNIGDRIKKR